ncbi:hypothetical protein F2Q69_00001777 [Brassica cretica]|uniref:Uncharacterized protein n=1 Tax=Brassica cretica TaxID=69181 RepID=A0A8S9P8U1_BRACR|nr:hypothetical protein F2Q69_00001777 [Brassica cretica]
MRDSLSVRDEISDPSFLILSGALTAEMGLSSAARWLGVQELGAPKRYVEEKDEQKIGVAKEGKDHFAVGLVTVRGRRRGGGDGGTDEPDTEAEVDAVQRTVF